MACHGDDNGQRALYGRDHTVRRGSAYERRWSHVSVRFAYRWLCGAALVGCDRHDLFVGHDVAPDAAYQEPEDAGALAPPAWDATPDAAGVEAGSRGCVEGEYEGDMAGEYRPGALGIAGIVGPFAATNDMLRTQAHWVFRIPPNPGHGLLLLSPICTWDVLPDGGLSDHGEELRGAINCDSGELVAELRGYSTSTSLTTLGLITEHFFFRGTLRGQFDWDAGTFTSTWIVREPRVAIGDAPGGEGGYRAQRMPLGARLLDAGTDCLSGVSFPEDKFQGDPIAGQ